MDRTFQVKESFIKEAHKAACSVWKSKLEKAFPDVALSVKRGLWYTNEMSQATSIFTWSEDDKYYGIEINKKDGTTQWYEGIAKTVDRLYFSTTMNLKLATDEEVVEALSIEAKKRGFVKGSKFIDNQSSTTVQIADLDKPDFWNIKSNDNSVKFHMSMQGGYGGVIFRRGVWSEIVKSKPFEVGNWYKHKEKPEILVFATEITPAKDSNTYSLTGYGFNFLGEWKKVWFASGVREEDYEVVLESEVVNILIDEAKKRGLKDGATVVLLNKGLNKNPKAYGKYKVNTKGELLIEGQYSWIVIMSEGRWAGVELKDTSGSLKETPTPEEITRVLDYLKSKQ